MRMRKKKNLLPRMERCGAYQIKDPYERKGRWHDLMPEAKEIRVELGCGKGRFTAETAAAEPDVLLIAVEKVPDAMVVAMERAAKRRAAQRLLHRHRRQPTALRFLIRARSTASMSTSATRGRPSGRPSAG